MDGIATAEGMEAATAKTEAGPEVVRDAGGRFAPGHSGNPAGKRKGTRNRATVLLEVMAEGEERVVARRMLDRAAAGEKAAGRLCFERLFPKPRSRTIELDLPEGASAADDLAVFEAAFAELVAGALTLDEMQTIARLLMIRARLRAMAAKEAAAAAASAHSAAAAGRGQGEGDAQAARPAAVKPAAGPQSSRLSAQRGAGDGKAAKAPSLHPACISPPEPAAGAPAWRGAA